MLMVIRTTAAPALLLACLCSCVLSSGRAAAQDVPGIEICTVEKTMERRTSCLQSNVNFLQATISKLAMADQQKLDAANRQIELLKSSIAGLQKTVADLQTAQKKPEAAPAAKDATLAKDAAPPAAPAAKAGAK
jgi:hypothetical protein